MNFSLYYCDFAVSITEINPLLLLLYTLYKIHFTLDTYPFITVSFKFPQSLPRAWNHVFKVELYLGDFTNKTFHHPWACQGIDVLELRSKNTYYIAGCLATKSYIKLEPKPSSNLDFSPNPIGSSLIQFGNPTSFRAQVEPSLEIPLTLSPSRAKPGYHKSI